MPEVTVIKEKSKFAPMSSRQMSREERLRREEEELKALIEGNQSKPEEKPEKEEETSNVIDEMQSDSDEDETEEETSDNEEDEASEEKDTETEKKKDKENNWEKRFKDSQRYINSLKDEIKELKDSLKKPDNNSLAKSVSEDEVKGWIKKYPDVAAIVEKIAEDKAKTSSTEIAERLKELERVKEEAERAKVESQIMKAHPDYSEINESTAFHNWVERKPAWVGKALYDQLSDAETISDILAMYKAATGHKTKRKGPDNRAAESPLKSSSRNVNPKDKEARYEFKESQINAMSIQEFERNEDAIANARRNGKILYDLSGAAR